MTEPKQDILFDAYEQWRLQPITRELIRCLEKHKQSFVDCIALNSTVAEVSDASIRHMTISLKDLDIVMKIINDYQTFKTLVNKK